MSGVFYKEFSYHANSIKNLTVFLFCQLNVTNDDYDLNQLKIIQ